MEHSATFRHFWQQATYYWLLQMPTGYANGRAKEAKGRHFEDH